MPLSALEEAPVEATMDLERALNQVEYYQPLYGVRGFEAALRSCRDRAVAIADALTALGRGFRLIDFGSSLGYFPFFFADRGAHTTGVDLNPANTAVALATQRVNGLPATFRTAPLDLEHVRALPPGGYDVALVLSVLHHINHQRGADYVAELLAELLARVPTLVLELAHRGEEVGFAWRGSLPESPLACLDRCGPVEVRSLGEFPSHLSSAVRPLYLVTRAATPREGAR